MTRAPRAECVCKCGHHRDAHSDGWAGCDLCDCNPYDGPRPEVDHVDHEARREFLAMVKKGA